MPFQIKRHEQVSLAVHRVVRQQIDRARREATKKRAPLDERIHAVRSRIKRARAALALTSATAGRRAARLDDHLRTLGRRLAHARDEEVTRAMLRDLVRETPLRAPPLLPPADKGRRALRAAIVDLEHLSSELERCRPRGDGRAARRAFARTFRRARQLRSDLGPRATAERFHRWRKVVKRLALQLRLLRGAAPELERALDAPLRRLVDLLGEIHDLSLLRTRLGTKKGRNRSSPDVPAVLERLDEHDGRARADALDLGARVLAPRTRAVKTWLGEGWHAWRGK
ncbi:MAG TPA: CHAD domain-containing protein [Polyangia bacterium]|jgi:CHAD domain-containing protein